MAEVIDMRGSWAANAARSKALQDARLQSHQAEAAALTKAHVKRRKVRQKLDAQESEQSSVDGGVTETEQAE